MSENHDKKESTSEAIIDGVATTSKGVVNVTKAIAELAFSSGKNLTSIGIKAIKEKQKSKKKDEQ